MALRDPHGRTINYLRLSVTDRCNLRCSYCMPPEGSPLLHRDEILGYDGLRRICRAAVAVGVEKIRITGGEPLVRDGIIGFLSDLSGIPGLQRLVLTTNGLLLPEMAADLHAAGVSSLNISLDSLQPHTFARITRGGDVTRVLAGIDAAERAGFSHIKINVVVMRGVNDDELAAFAALTLDRPYRVRFIEQMPVGNGSGELTVPGSELLDRLGRAFRLEPVAREPLAGPASYYRIAGGSGMIGVITPVSCHFCGDCNRIRVNSAGIARSCLFAEGVTDLKPLLLNDDDTLLEAALRRIVATKPERHRLAEGDCGGEPLRMSQIGG